MSQTRHVRADLRAAVRHHQRGYEHNQAGRPARGARAVAAGLASLGLASTSEPPQDAAENVELAELVTRMLATHAKSDVEMYGVEHGLATMDRAARWASGAGLDLRAFLHGQRALVLFRGGQFGDAVPEFDRAVELTADLTLDRCRLLLNRGALFIEMGRIDQARADITRSLELSRTLDLVVLTRVGLHNLGCLEFIAGDLPLALRLIDQGLEMDGETQQGIAHRDRSRVLLAAGLRQEADDSLAVAGQLLSRDRCWQDVGEVELARAESALLGGDARNARRLAGRARDRFRRYGNDRWRRTAELTLLQADLRDGRPLGRLVAHAHRLAGEFGAAGFLLQARTAALLAAEMEQGLGRVERAADIAARAGQPQESDPIALRLQVRYVQARLRLAEHNKTEAKRDLRAGMAELATYQSQFGGIDLQTASAVHGTRLAELDLEVALGEGTPAAVLAAVERGRAISRRLRVVTPPADEVAAGLLTELRRVTLNVRDKAADPDAAAEVAADRQRIAELQRELRARSWRTIGTGEGDRPASGNELRAAFGGSDQRLVSYLEAAGALHAVVIDADRARLVHLGPAAPVHEQVARLRADLDVLAQRGVPAPLTAAARSSCARALQLLDASLLAPMAADGRPYGRLVVIPSGRLLTLPWSLLPSLVGRPVEVAPSATSWLHATRRPAGSELVAVALLSGPGLRRAEDEIGAIRSAWGAAVIPVAPGAAGLRDILARADLVHVAAHGEHQPESPMFSSLQLDGGPVFAYELDQANHRAGHVILSACDLGRTTVRAGEEPLGLTSALLHLGTRCVVAGVTRVNDDVAAAVMADYHHRLAAGADSAAALAEACDTAGERSAPFVAFGAAWTANPGARH